MKISERAYQGYDDLFRIGNFLRRVQAEDPSWNAWSVTHFDIWAQRRIAEERVEGRTGWHANVRLWEKEDGLLLGAAALLNGSKAAIFSSSDPCEMAELELCWLENRFSEINHLEKPLGVEIFEGNRFISNLAQGRGYQKSKDFMNSRFRLLNPTDHDSVNLPKGYTIRHIENRADLLRHVEAVAQTFNLKDTEAIYQAVIQAPSYYPELNLLVLDDAAETAAVGTVWYDPSLRMAEFELVGALEPYRGMGLRAALMAEGSNRLRRMGCRIVTVDSWSGSPAENKLYESAGFEVRDRVFEWSWQPA